MCTLKVEGVYDNATKTITWENIDSTVTALTFNYSGTSYLSGSATIPLNHAQADASSAVNVNYDYTAPTPADPGWYSVVPADIAFTDTNKDMDTSSLVNADDQKTPYNGSKQVSVTVKSDNAYKFKDDAGDTVDYQLDKNEMGTAAFDPNNNTQDLGTLDRDNAFVASKAHLIGTATKTGEYTDILHNVFEQTN